MKLPETFRSLRYHNYRLYFAGQSVSLIGTWMQRMAANWLIYSLTHSAFILGFANFAELIPALVLSPVAGTLTDRKNRYKLLLITQIVSMVQAGILALLVLTNHYNVTIIILLSTVLGIINAFDIPSRQSLVIELIEDKRDITNAIGLNSSMVNLARLIGPALAGIILSAWGEGICFLLNFLSFAAVIGSLLLMKIDHSKAKPRKSGNTASSFREGYNYLKQMSGLRSVILMVACTSLLVIPYSTLLPVFAKDVFHGDEMTFGLLNSLSGLGALIGAIYLASIKSDKNIIKILMIASILFFISLILFSFSQAIMLALVFATTGGLGRMIQMGSSNTYIQTNVEDDMRGRILSFYVMALQGMQPFGSMLVGFVAHKIGAPLAVCLQGIAGVIVFLIFIPSIRRAGLRQEVKIRWARREVESYKL